MNISADAMLSYIIAALGGFFLKYLWDKLVKEQNNKEEKAIKYDEKELQETIEKIVKNSCITFKGELEKSLNDFKIESKSTFEYWQKKYWEAVDNLREVEKDFRTLREQDLQFYKYQLINACKLYISQGKMTQFQFDKLTELHKIYNSLGGNSQGDLYYNKAISLPIVKDDERVLHEDWNVDDLFVDAEDMKAHNEK